MPTLVIQYVDDNGRHIGSHVKITADYVPRIGELICSKNDAKKDLQTFYILNIVNRIVDGKLSPYIIAKSWWNDNRLEESSAFEWRASDATYNLSDTMYDKF